MTPSDTCLANSICAFIYERTGNAALADASYQVLIKPARIIAIIVIAFLLRLAVRRVVKRIVRRASGARNRERGQGVETNPRWKRRQQRADTLGAVLRSLATATIFMIAVLMIIGELGVDVAPLIAGAGFLGLSLGIGAQHVVKDFIAGAFMLLEDQYGVGDVVDLDAVSGVVEAVSLRVTTVRDAEGVVWYVRNGEILQVGNRNHGWIAIIIDVPVGLSRVGDVMAKLRETATAVATDPTFGDDLLEPPDVDVEKITADGAVVRITTRTNTNAKLRIGRELRRRVTETLDETASRHR